MALFGGRNTTNPLVAQARFHFVGQAFAAMATALGAPADDDDPIECLLNAAQSPTTHA